MKIIAPTVERLRRTSVWNILWVSLILSEILTALKDANRRLLERTAREKPEFKKVLDSQQAYLEKAREWTMISDFAYLDSVRGEE